MALQRGLLKPFQRLAEVALNAFAVVIELTQLKLLLAGRRSTRGLLAGFEGGGQFFRRRY